jgi:hypothetical protein
MLKLLLNENPHRLQVEIFLDEMIDSFENKIIAFQLRQHNLFYV